MLSDKELFEIAVSFYENWKYGNSTHKHGEDYLIKLDETVAQLFHKWLSLEREKEHELKSNED